MTNLTSCLTRSDGEEVVVDNKFMRESYPLLVIYLHFMQFIQSLSVQMARCSMSCYVQHNFLQELKPRLSLSTVVFIWRTLKCVF